MVSGCYKKGLNISALSSRPHKTSTRCGFSEETKLPDYVEVHLRQTEEGWTGARKNFALSFLFVLFYFRFIGNGYSTSVGNISDLRTDMKR